MLYFLRSRRIAKRERVLRELCEQRLMDLAHAAEAGPTATGAFNLVKDLVDQATEEKKKTRSTLQKLFDMLPGERK